jgi:IS605 OrfB family transposase
VIPSYRYPIYPTKDVEQKLLESLNTCRWPYNSLLEEMNTSWESGRTLTTYDTQNIIPSLKSENSGLGKVYSKVLRMVNYALHSIIASLDALKKKGRKVGHLRFKGKNWYNTLNYNQSGFKLDQDHSILKLKDRLNKVHVKINNQRADFLHKLSRMYVNEYDIICVGDLDVKGLKEKGSSKGTHRNIHDASWSKFRFMLSYTAQSAGRKLIAVDPRNTSQRCSSCGSVVKKKKLSDRGHDCPYCGFSSERDYNAAMNILFAGMGLPIASIEPKPIHHVFLRQVLAMKWEALPIRVG